MSKKPIPPEPFLTEDARLAYEHFLPIVQRIPDNEVQVCNGDPSLIRHNVDGGMTNLLQHEAIIRRKLPETDLAALRELPSLALGLIYADERIFVRASDGEIAEALKQVRPMRELTLSYLEIAADLGLLPVEVPRGIRKGKGPLDTARDAVAIPGAFADYAAALHNKHPFTAEYLAELRRLGNWLLVQLKPQDAIPDAAERAAANIIRDRFFTEILRRYETALEVGTVVYGYRKVDEHMPAMLARLRPGSGPQQPPGGGNGGGAGNT